MENPLKREHAEWMGIPWDDPAGQGPLEAWAILMALRKWKHRIRVRFGHQVRQRGCAGHGVPNSGAITGLELDRS